jgi:hypothetical protein
MKCLKIRIWLSRLAWLKVVKETIKDKKYLRLLAAKKS